MSAVNCILISTVFMMQNFVLEKYYFSDKTFFIHFLCETLDVYIIKFNGVIRHIKIYIKQQYKILI